MNAPGTNVSRPDLVVDDNGNVGVGTSTPAFTFQVSGNADITGELTAASDRRLKKNINDITDAVKTIRGLRPVHYDFRTDEFPEMNLASRHKMGLIAQEVEEVLPALVSQAGKATRADGTEVDIKSVNYVELVPLLVASIQELKDELEAKDAEIAELRSDMASRLSAIEQLLQGSSSASDAEE